MAIKLHWVCTMCVHYQRAAAIQKPFTDCGKVNCFSPIAGGWFASYEGILRHNGDHMHDWCFMCGDKAVAGVKVEEHFLGICERHIAHLRTRVHRGGGTVRDVYTQERHRQVWACDDAALRHEDDNTK